MTSATLELTGREEEWRFAPFDLFAPLLSERDLTTHDRVLGDGVSETISHSQESVIMDVRVVDHGQAALTLPLTGGGASRCVLNVHVGTGATLRLNVIGELDADAVRLINLNIFPGRDSSIFGNAVALSAKALRIETLANFAEPGASVELLGLTFGSGQDYLEQRLRIVHDAPHCTSSVTYKSAAMDRSHLVWVGDIVINRAGVGTQTYELNRNLLLSGAARIDSVPNLELETGDVIGAGHASATGRIDDEHIFYLQSRGIPADVAQRIVVEGFFAELLSKMELGDREEEILSSIHERLEIS